MDSGIAPKDGARIVIRGCLQCFKYIGPSGDGFANDAIWRASPLRFWEASIRTALSTWISGRRVLGPSYNTSLHANTHTGVRGVHRVQRSRIALRGRTFSRCLRQVDKIDWPRAVRPCRARSVDIGPAGAVVRVDFKPITPYHGSSGNPPQICIGRRRLRRRFRMVHSIRSRIISSNLTDYAAKAGCSRRPRRFTYKRIWYAGSSFAQCLYFRFPPISLRSNLSDHQQ